MKRFLVVLILLGCSGSGGNGGNANVPPEWPDACLTYFHIAQNCIDTNPDGDALKEQLAATMFYWDHLYSERKLFELDQSCRQALPTVQDYYCVP